MPRSGPVNTPNVPSNESETVSLLLNTINAFYADTS
jgi:hypothetical protein